MSNAKIGIYLTPGHFFGFKLILFVETVISDPNIKCHFIQSVHAQLIKKRASRRVLTLLGGKILGQRQVSLTRANLI